MQCNIGLCNLWRSRVYGRCPAVQFRWDVMGCFRAHDYKISVSRRLEELRWATLMLSSFIRKHALIQRHALSLICSKSNICLKSIYGCKLPCTFPLLHAQRFPLWSEWQYSTPGLAANQRAHSARHLCGFLRGGIANQFGRASAAELVEGRGATTSLVLKHLTHSENSQAEACPN